MIEDDSNESTDEQPSRARRITILRLPAVIVKWSTGTVVGVIPPRVGLVVVGLLMAGCTGGGGVSSNTTGGVDVSVGSAAMSAITTGGSACEWLTVETVERSLGVAVAEPPEELTDDVWSCVWRGSDAELSVRFDRFEPGFRSVEAELTRLRQDDAERPETVEGLRGAFSSSGVWYGETPLEQYGMMTIRLTRADRTEPDLAEFEPVVAAVIDDVITAAPAVPW
jgi:hypothetical protein